MIYFIKNMSKLKGNAKQESMELITHYANNTSNGMGRLRIGRVPIAQTVTWEDWELWGCQWNKKWHGRIENCGGANGIKSDIGGLRIEGEVIVNVHVIIYTHNNWFQFNKQVQVTMWFTLHFQTLSGWKCLNHRLASVLTDIINNTSVCNFTEWKILTFPFKVCKIFKTYANPKHAMNQE